MVTVADYNPRPLINDNEKKEGQMIHGKEMEHDTKRLALLVIYMSVLVVILFGVLPLIWFPA